MKFMTMTVKRITSGSTQKAGASSAIAFYLLPLAFSLSMLTGIEYSLTFQEVLLQSILSEHIH